MDEKILEYRAVFRRIVKKAPGPEQIERLLEMIASRNYIQLVERLWTGNKASRKIFEMETGIKLPATATGTNEALQKYCGENYIAWKSAKDAKRLETEKQRQLEKQEEDARLNQELDGFMGDRPKMERVRALNVLTDQRCLHTYHGEKFSCIRDWIRKVVDVDNDFEACVFNDTEYFLQYVREDGMTYYKDVTKTAYNYAKYLLSRKQSKQEN